MARICPGRSVLIAVSSCASIIFPCSATHSSPATFLGTATGTARPLILSANCRLGSLGPSLERGPSRLASAFPAIPAEGGALAAVVVLDDAEAAGPAGSLPMMFGFVFAPFGRAFLLRLGRGSELALPAHLLSF